MIFVHCKNSKHANDAIGFGFLTTTSLLSAVLTITQGKRALFNKMKTNLIKLFIKQVLKLRKDKQSGALPY